MTAAAEKELLKEVLYEYTDPEAAFWVFRQNCLNTSNATEGAMEYPIFLLNRESSVSLVHTPMKRESKIVFRTPGSAGNFYVMSSETFLKFQQESVGSMIMMLLMNINAPQGILEKYPQIVTSGLNNNVYHLKINGKLLVIIRKLNGEWVVMFKAFRPCSSEAQPVDDPHQKALHTESANFFHMSFGAYQYFITYLAPRLYNALAVYEVLPPFIDLIPETHEPLRFDESLDD